MIEDNKPLLFKNDSDGLQKKLMNHPLTNSKLLGLALFYFFITYVISGLTNENLYTDNRVQWIYSEIIYFIFVIMLWLSSPYIISRFREKLVMMSCGILFLIICLFRAFIPSIMVFPMILLAIATMLVWTSAGGYLFLLNNSIKNYNLPGLSFGVFFGLKGLNYLFVQLESRTTIIISFIIFILIGLILVFLLADPSKEFEKEHHDIRDIKSSLLSPIKYLKDNQDFLILIPTLVYLGFSSVLIDVSALFERYPIVLYSIIYGCTAVGFGVLYDKNFNRVLLVGSLSISGVLLSIFLIINYYLDSGSARSVLQYFISIFMAVVNGGLSTLIYININSITTIFKTLSAATNAIFFIQCGSFIGFIFYSWVGLFIFIYLILLFVGLLSILYIYKFIQNQNQTQDNNNHNNNNNHNIDNNNYNHNNTDNNNSNNLHDDKSNNINDNIDITEI